MTKVEARLAVREVAADCSGVVKVSYDYNIGVWRAVPAELRLPLLLEVVARYRDDCCHPPDGAPEDLIGKDAVTIIRSGLSTNDFITAGYRLAAGRERKALHMEVNEEQAFTILRTAYHTCGHGEDTDPPLGFALRHFRDRLYSSAFLDALRVYRGVLAQTSRPTTTQCLIRREEGLCRRPRSIERRMERRRRLSKSHGIDNDLLTRLGGVRGGNNRSVRVSDKRVRWRRPALAE